MNVIKGNMADELMMNVRHDKISVRDDNSLKMSFHQDTCSQLVLSLVTNIVILNIANYPHRITQLCVLFN